jgi:hypothetical protein
MSKRKLEDETFSSSKFPVVENSKKNEQKRVARSLLSFEVSEEIKNQNSAARKIARSKLSSEESKLKQNIDTSARQIARLNLSAEESKLKQNIDTSARQIARQNIPYSNRLQDPMEALYFFYASRGSRFDGNNYNIISFH